MATVEIFRPNSFDLVSLDIEMPVTILTGGDAGLRAIHHLVPDAEHVLDWFYVSMRFQNLKQVAKGFTV